MGYRTVTVASVHMGSLCILRIPAITYFVYKLYLFYIWLILDNWREKRIE